MDKFRIAFNKFDKDGGGTIDAEELGSAMHSLGQNLTRLELQDIIDSVDADNSGTIDFPEFLVLMRAKLADMDTVDDLVEALDLFDPRNSGSVTEAVLKHALLNLGEKLSDEDVAYVFARLPRDASGRFCSRQIAQTLLSN